MNLRTMDCSWLMFLGLAAMIVAAGGCNAPYRETGIAGHSLGGKPIEYQLHGRSGPLVMVIASIHGNEPAGTPLVRWLDEYLTRRPELIEGTRVLIVPVANPDGYLTRKRFNKTGVDLNRNFPTGNRVDSARNGRPLSEPESRVLMGLIEKHQPDRVISIHQPLSVLDYDGPGKAMAEAMKLWCELPVKRVGSLPGSLGSYVGIELKRPIVTVELPGGAENHPFDEIWSRYGRMLLAGVMFPREPPEIQ